jgi:hypothetical protein
MRAKATTKGGARMGEIRGGGRHQTYLLPATIDDSIGEENPRRFLDAFVEQLSLGQIGFVRATAAEPGRPGENPGDRLRLYLYGCLNGIRSRRRLAKEATRHLAWWKAPGRRPSRPPAPAICGSFAGSDATQMPGAPAGKRVTPARDPWTWCIPESVHGWNRARRCGSRHRP